MVSKMDLSDTKFSQLKNVRGKFLVHLVIHESANGITVNEFDVRLMVQFREHLITHLELHLKMHFKIYKKVHKKVTFVLKNEHVRSLHLKAQLHLRLKLRVRLQLSCT